MKIILTSGIFPPDIGGPATFVPEFAKHISKTGLISQVISLRPKVKVSVEDSSNLKLIKRRYLPLRVINTTCVIFFAALKSDRIFSNGLYLEASIAARLSRKRAIAKIVGDPVWERSRNNKTTNLTLQEFQTSRLSPTNYILRKIYKYVFNSFSVLTCPSEELVEIIRKWGVSPQVVHIPNGVRIPNIKKQRKEYDLVFVGRLVPWKNVDLIIKIATDLKLKVLIIGDGPEKSRLELLATESSADCLFTGELNNLLVHDYMSRSKLFALFSQYEGLSFALLEALAHGVPALVSNTAGNLGVVTDNWDSIVFDLDNFTDSYSRVAELLRDENKLTEFGENARTNVGERFDLNLRLDEMLKLIDSAS